MNRTLCLWALSAIMSGLWAQPDTDIFLLEVDHSGEGLSFSNPVNLTPRKGYDNQPSFLPDGSAILYTSIMADGQAEIMQYDLETRNNKRITRTKGHSEYSPQITPDGKYISAVVVEPDSSQRIWRYDLKDGHGERLTNKFEGVGYYAWYHKKRMATFVLGDTFTLQALHVKKQKPAVLASDVGRAVQPCPDFGQVSFVLKESADKWQICIWNPRTKSIKVITETLPGQEDYCWTPEGHLLMGEGHTLYRFRPGISTAWESLGELPVEDFYRLSMSPDGRFLAVVAYRGDKP